MIKRNVLWIVGLVAAVGVSNAAAAQNQGPGGVQPSLNGPNRPGRPGAWVYLGNRSIDGAADHDEIPISGNKGPFRGVQFRVQGGMVRFDRIQVKFANGQSTNLTVRADIPAGGRTREIDLPGDRRNISSILMWYRKANWRTRPTINVYGIR